MAGDIFEKDPSGSAFSDNPGNMGPEVAGGGFALAGTGEAEGLTRIARTQDIHAAPPWSSVKTGEVIPEGGGVKAAVMDAGGKDTERRRVLFNVADCAEGRLGKRDAEVKARCPGTE